MPLKKSLKFIQVFSITVGSMTSSGIFILPAVAYSKAGPAILAAYFLGGVFALIGSFSMIELTTAMPKAGGIYFFASRSLGGLTGTLSGILMWVAISMKAAFAVYGLSAILSFYTDVNFYIFAVLFVILYAGLNIKGIKEAAIVDVCLVSIIIFLMLIFSFIGINSVSIERFSAFVPDGKDPLLTIIGTAAFVFIAFGGVMNAANISEEMADPKKDIPRAILSAIILITVLYTLIIFTTVGLLDPNNLVHSINPVADAARNILGLPGFVIITITACIAFSSCANSGIMSSSRYPYALSKDKFLPGFFSYINPKTNTPVVAIITTSVFILLVLLLDLKTLVEAASTVIITSYIITDLSVIILRVSRINTYKPTFKAPFFPLLPVVSIIIFTSLIFFMGWDAVELSFGLILISCLVYLFYAKNNTTNYALLHVIERMTNKKMTSAGLEDELKEIIHHRDDVVKDDFDRLIESSDAVDINGPVELEDFFRMISEILEPKVNYSKGSLFNLLTEREKDSPTVLLPTVAVPHIIIESDNCFEILLARCRKGVRFSDEYPDVKAIVVIIGSRNKRNLHLRTLAAIAQIIQDANFDKQWNAALNSNSLKNIFLTADRKRMKGNG